MKKILSLVLFSAALQITFAQMAATVNYTETVQLKFNFEGMQPPPDLPKEHSIKTILYFNDKAALYTNDEAAMQQDAAVNEENGEGGMMIMHMAPPDNKLYTDLNEKTVTRKEDFMQRTFLIEGKMDTTQWKLTGKQKFILNYPCMEAVSMDTAKHVSVWYTPAFPVSLGPSRFCGLPGLILEVNIDNGDRVITATNIVKEVDASKIVKPTDGKKVTDEEYQKIVAEKLKEMGIDDDGSGGPRIMIKVEDH